MTTFLVPDGTYYIRNVQFNTSYVAEVNGLPLGALATWTSSSTPSTTNQQWTVKNLGNNVVTLENGTAKGYYASAWVYSKGTPLFGSQNPTYWTIKRVSNGVFNIAADDLQWATDQGTNRTPVLLGPYASSQPAEQLQWNFVPV